MRVSMVGAAVIALLPMAALSAPRENDSLAAKFGARPFVIDASLSPDGRNVAFVVPVSGKGTAVLVADVDGKSSKYVGVADGNPLKLTSCGWSANDRLVCGEYGLALAYGTLSPFTRTVAFDKDGGNKRALGRDGGANALRVSQYDGGVLDWLSGADGMVLMQRDIVPNGQLGSRIAETRDGLAVERVDTRTGTGTVIEPPNRSSSGFISDGQGRIRIMIREERRGEEETLTGKTSYFYRVAGSRAWTLFSEGGDPKTLMRPIAVDGTSNVAYALKRLDGRDALYRVALDGSMKAELVLANPQVDIDDVVSIGRNGRVIGAAYVTDKPEVEYFDPAYKALATSLGRALPKLPLVKFAGASADEKQLLIWAGSDSDPGHYYLFDRATRHLNELTPVRPQLEGVHLAETRSVSYRTEDGQMVPAYLTLPPGSDGKHLPAIVMPHGGPGARDQWGFDWLPQYFAQRGYAVFQPEFRGSSGYGDAWFVDNGFKSWKTAIGDINAGGRWLVSQGIADPAKLAIVGWSYGGYAALQAQVAEPDLFKAVVAVAPVTDLATLKAESLPFTNHDVESRFIGNGPHVIEGSPALHADRFRAPVLMFHGDQDLNVGVGESRMMDAALKRAGKASDLVIYRGLDHQLDDDAARTDMLGKADAFLRVSMNMPVN